MGFKKKTRLTAAISAVLVFALCVGGMAADAYAAVPTSTSAANTSGQFQPENFSVQPQEISNLTLIEKEYTLDELKALNISGIVAEVSSENVSVIRGGDTLKFSYYAQKQDEYTLQREDDGGKTRWNLCLLRKNSSIDVIPGRPITITIPNQVNLKALKVLTSSGNISLTNCTTSLAMAVMTESGQISIHGGAAGQFFKVETKSGNAFVSGTTLPIASSDDPYSTVFTTESGVFTFQPADSVQNYGFEAETAGKVTINGREFQNGNQNDNAAKKVYFESSEGSLIVRELSLGNLSIPAATVQSGTVISTRHEPESSGGLERTRKVYTANDLQRLGVEGVRVEGRSENIMVQRGGDSLVIEYDQSGDKDYLLKTGRYELYNEEYMTPDELAAHGNVSGIVNLLEIRRIHETNLDGQARAISITLPEDPKFNRVIKVITTDGNIQVDRCISTAMIDAMTKNGNILMQNCDSPDLGVVSENGKISVTGCKTNNLDAGTVSGTLALQLPDSASNYKMAICTGDEAHISVNGKIYQGGEFVLNKNAVNHIRFDSEKGSLVITEAVAESYIKRILLFPPNPVVVKDF